MHYPKQIKTQNNHEGTDSRTSYPNRVPVTFLLGKEGHDIQENPNPEPLVGD